MEGVAGMMARLSHMQRVAAGGSAMYRTRVFFSFVVTATVATSHEFFQYLIQVLERGPIPKNSSKY